MSPKAAAQTLTQRGFVDGSVVLFPQEALNDSTQAVADLLAREEVFFKPATWLQFGAGLDARANSHDQVEDSWRLDFTDRGMLRPRLAVRRLSATFTRGPLTIDAGKQFIRWGKTDVLTPTDRFAPRDFLNVVDAEFIGVTGLRGVVLVGAETFEAVWLPRFTPSRVPLIDQRWTVVPAAAANIPLVDGGAIFPDASQTGVRWGHTGAGFEYSLSFFDGFNHLPNFDVAVEPAPPSAELTRIYPSMRMYGGDTAVPTRLFTLKGEAAYFTTASPATDEYVLYVIQVERQTGEWVIVAGYAGEVVTLRRSTLDFAPDRGLTKSIVARVSYTIGPTRSVAFESAIRQNGAGMYAKGEYSQSRGAHWRATISGVLIRGEPDDFLGQYRLNSYVKGALRYSF
ncbi:MAG TPA: hypothetical protein VKE96_33765 [Vicinamibacterales bacterium]|nr:hypothetical protein [Vicinamibacterales bacterium]